MNCKNCGTAVRDIASYSFINYNLCNKCLHNRFINATEKITKYECIKPVAITYQITNLHKPQTKKIGVGTLCSAYQSNDRFFINDGQDIMWFGMDAEEFKDSFTIMDQLTLF